MFLFLSCVFLLFYVLAFVVFICFCFGLVLVFGFCLLLFFSNFFLLTSFCLGVTLSLNAILTERWSHEQYICNGGAKQINTKQYGDNVK